MFCRQDPLWLCPPPSCWLPLPLILLLCSLLALLMSLCLWWQTCLSRRGALLHRLLFSLNIIFLKNNNFLFAILHFIISILLSQCNIAFGVDIGRCISFLMNLSWKPCKLFICASVTPIQLSLLNNNAGITWASNSFIAAKDDPSAPIMGASASTMISLTLLVSFLIRSLISSMIYYDSTHAHGF